MKTQIFKSLIKQAVKEAIQEELKEVLLEAVRSPKHVISEGSVSPPPSSTMSSSDKRAAYQNILGDMQSQFTSQNVAKPFNPSGAVPGGDLPPGEVDMSQIMGLMKK
jgi:hypothetical protein